MRENEKQPDRHLDAPQEANDDKHNNFRSAEENTGNFANDKSATDRRKEWQQAIKDGEEQNKGTSAPPAMPLDADDTLGIP